MISYNENIMDSFGYIHSIDNVIITYDLCGIGDSIIQSVIDAFHDIRDKIDGLDYWERLDCKPCSKYSWYAHQIHLDKGFYVQLGHWQMFRDDKKEFLIFPLMKIEINPNKYANTPIFEKLMNLVSEYAIDYHIDKIDYAIDVKTIPDNVNVYGTKKEKGLYKGTRYYGQRHKNGYLKIYDKRKESGLEYDCTRIEYTFEYKKRNEINFDAIYITNNNESSGIDGAGETANCKLVKKSPAFNVIVELCKNMKENNLEYQTIIDKLDRRMKYDVQTALRGDSNKLEYKAEILNTLLENIDKLYGKKEFKEENKNINEFVTLSEKELKSIENLF